MTAIVDDKSQHCISFILSCIKARRQTHNVANTSPPPFFVGINGVQGAGKTTLVSTLRDTLSSSSHNLPTLVLSIDDLYLPHAAQLSLAKTHPSNPLVQHRGQPSTHDISLGTALFSALNSRETGIKVPSYDKSAFQGQGDRRPEEEWTAINAPGSPSVEVVIFEGWCVGFRPLSAGELERKWREARAESERLGEGYQGQLGRLELSSVEFVNDALKEYDRLTDRLDAMVHIDAEDPRYVYKWRQQQEAALRAEKGSGMTPEQVDRFVDGYYPAYELYTAELRKGAFSEPGRQLRLVIGSERNVISAQQM